MAPRPSLTPEQVRARPAPRRLSQIEPLADGEIAQAFGALLDGRPVVVRFAPTDRGFRKDAVARKRWNSPAIPIPPMLEIGRAGEMAFAISERIEGRHHDLKRLSRAEYLALTPELWPALDAIHAADPGTTSGFGSWDPMSLDGEHQSWRDVLLDTATPGDAALMTTWRDADGDDRLVEQAHRDLVRLAERAPETRRVIHSDFGFNNVLLDSGRLVAVLDWDTSGYGDPAMDLAWLAFFDTTDTVLPSYKRHAIRSGRDLRGLDDRVRAGVLHIGLGTGRWCAQREQWDFQRWTGERMAQLAGLQRNGVAIA